MSHRSNMETVERVVAAPAEAIFALLADPDRHHEFDGSGTVRNASGGSRYLRLGSRFGMSMRAGVPYSMMNTVIEYEEGRLIAWQTRAPGVFGKLIGGRIWRFDLEPRPNGTLISESWDISEEAALSRPIVRRMARVTRRNMATTLERIQKIVVDT